MANQKNQSKLGQIIIGLFLSFDEDLNFFENFHLLTECKYDLRTFGLHCGFVRQPRAKTTIIDSSTCDWEKKRLTNTIYIIQWKPFFQMVTLMSNRFQSFQLSVQKIQIRGNYSNYSFLEVQVLMLKLTHFFNLDQGSKKSLRNKI